MSEEPLDIRASFSCAKPTDGDAGPRPCRRLRGHEGPCEAVLDRAKVLDHVDFKRRELDDCRLEVEGLRAAREQAIAGQKPYHPSLVVDFLREAELRLRALEAEAEREDLLASFDLRWKADARAIERWRAGHPERELRQPDHADLVVWLMEQLEALERGDRG